MIKVLDLATRICERVENGGNEEITKKLSALHAEGFGFEAQRTTYP